MFDTLGKIFELYGGDTESYIQENLSICDIENNLHT